MGLISITVKSTELHHKLLEDLKKFFVDRVDYSGTDKGFSFRSFSFVLNFDEDRMQSGESWTQKVLVVNSSDESHTVHYLKKFVEDEHNICIYIYDQDVELLPILKQNFFHCRYHPVFDEKAYLTLLKSILTVIPEDSLAFTAQHKVKSESFQENLIKWMILEEEQFGSKTGRDLLRKIYPYSDLLKKVETV